MRDEPPSRKPVFEPRPIVCEGFVICIALRSELRGAITRSCWNLGRVFYSEPSRHLLAQRQALPPGYRQHLIDPASSSLQAIPARWRACYVRREPVSLELVKE